MLADLVCPTVGHRGNYRQVQNFKAAAGGVRKPATVQISRKIPEGYGVDAGFEEKSSDAGPDFGGDPDGVVAQGRLGNLRTNQAFSSRKVLVVSARQLEAGFMEEAGVFQVPHGQGGIGVG